MPFDWSPLAISLRTVLCAGVLVFVLGIGFARLFLYAGGRVKWITDVIFTLPLVLPPTVIGFFLLVLFGKNSPLGRTLAQIGLSLIFTWQATVAAAVVVSFPLMYRAAKGAFEQVDENLIWAARTLGMSEWTIFIRVLIPQAWPGIAAGTALSFARALGEFGATLMIAGNIPGRTQTIPIAIYFATAAGNMRTAGIWVAVITAVSCLALGLMNYYNARAKGGGA
ncbi:MAG: molybdate ABC transporter permease subunit [Ruminococcaceae bacterium]|jgi:molybdate transport system permease protein|nr:molybdate ABC transporter permease subunit [Oscillospiraceae bacterium]